ncbi:MAG TPA: DMT family transporter [Luteibaculaceae bacterium]|nr:DMT family transporter [Luteibaculaceae bacterium]
MQSTRYSLQSWAILIILALIWGSSFILMKQGLKVFNGTQVGALRLSIAAICVLPIAILSFKKIERRHIGPLLIVGFLGNGLPAFLFATAQTRLASAQAGILNGLTPFFVFVIGAVFFQLKPNLRSVSGVVLGFLGAAGLILSRQTGEAGLPPMGHSLLIVLATLFYGISANVISHRCKGLKSYQISSVALSFILLPALAVLMYSGAPHVLSTVPGAGKALGYIFVLAVFGTAIAVILFNKLLSETSAMFGSSVTYLMPIVAVIWGLADGEALRWVQGLFTLLILSGIYLVNYQPKKVDY